MKWHHFVNFIGISFLFIKGISADPVSVNKRPRMEAMGNAGLAARGNHDSAMMNPAGLSDVKKRQWDIFPLLVEVPFDIGVINSFLDYNDARSSSTTNEQTKRQKFEDFLREFGSSAIATRVNFYPSYTMNQFHAGLLVDALVNPRLRVSGAGSNQLVELGGSAGTFGAMIGGSYSFLQNSIQVGMTLKPLYRIAFTENQAQTLHDVLFGQNSGESVQNVIFGEDFTDRTGFGVGIDLGVKYWVQPAYGLDSIVNTLKPALGLTYQDIGNTRFFGDSDRPADIDQSLSIGIALHPKISILHNTFALDFRNLNEKQEFLNKVHFGAESRLFNMFYARFGISQGYVTGGIGVDLPYFEADVYVTAEEAGESANIQDQRTLGLKLAAVF